MVPKKGLELEALSRRERAESAEADEAMREPAAEILSERRSWARVEGPRLIRTTDWKMVPKKGLEPPRPCGHMDLNHARLPIPPLRLK